MQTLNIKLLGSPSVHLDGHPISQTITTKAQALLYYLITTGRTHYRGELASLFWPDMPNVQARKNLRNILPVLRSHIGSHIIVTRQTATINHHMPYWIDVKAFESLLGGAPSQVGTETLWEAVTLYDDDFLAGFYVRHAPLFEEWMLLERERLRDRLMDGLQTLATRHLHEKDYHAALKATRRMLSIEPWHEHAHQQQMHALAGLGQRSAALAQYEMCCRILDEEFCVVPGNEITRLYEQIKTAVVTEPPTHLQLPPHLDTTSTTRSCPSLFDRTYSLPMVMSSDGQVMAVPGKDNTIHLQSLVTRRCIHLLSGHTAPVTTLLFSLDDTILASASADQTVRLWGVASGTLLTTLSAHSASVTAIDFSPDGMLLASASADQTVRLWDVAGGTLLDTLQEHGYPVVNIVFSPDGTNLISVDSEHVVLFWNVSIKHRLVHSVAAHPHVRQVAWPVVTSAAPPRVHGQVREQPCVELG